MSEEHAIIEEVEGEGQTEEESTTKQPINRREALNLAWLASLGFLVLNVGGVAVLFGYPRFKEGEFGGIVRVGAVADLPEVGTPPENFPKVKFWLVNAEDGVRALYKVCPHLGCLYGWSDQEFKFICPCHGSQYEYEGDYIQGPAPRSLDEFVVRVVDGETGEVLAETPEEGGPVELPDAPNAEIVVDTGKKITGQKHN